MKYTKEDFEIQDDDMPVRFYAMYSKRDYYLFKPGVVENWNDYCEKYDCNNKERDKNVYFSSKEELEECLDKFLKGQNMASKERLEQVKKDIKLLQEEEKRIEKELAKDPIDKYIEEHPFNYSCYRQPENKYESIVRDKSHVKIVLPTANSGWTWAAYQWAKDFCETMEKLGFYVYPVHAEGKENHKYLYIKI